MAMTDQPYTGSDVLEFLKEAKNYNQSLVKLITNHFKTGLALDFGAGLGTFTQLIQNETRRIECVELDNEQRGILSAAGFTAFKDISETPHTYNFIYSLNVLEHIEEDSVAAANLVGRLNPGGMILIFVPAFQCLYSGFDKKVGHYRRYRKNQLALLFPDLEVLELRYFDTLGFLAAWIFKMISGDKDGAVSTKAIWIFDRLIFPLNKIFDPLFSPWIGKNVLFVARKKT